MCRGTRMGVGRAEGPSQESGGAESPLGHPQVKMKAKRILAALCGVMMALAGALAVLTAVINGLGASQGMMLSLMEQHAPAEKTGLPQEHYAPMAAMITGYLSGETDIFQYTFTDAQERRIDCFHDYEQQHMADCRALFTLDRAVMAASTLLLIPLGWAAWALRPARAWTAAGFLDGCAAVLLAAMGLTVWGIADFSSLFVLFHRLSFDNGLWLLNPQTDLLIRLMPMPLFISYGAILGGTWLGALLMMGSVAWYLKRRWKTYEVNS